MWGRPWVACVGLMLGAGLFLVWVPVAFSPALAGGLPLGKWCADPATGALFWGSLWWQAAQAPLHHVMGAEASGSHAYCLGGWQRGPHDHSWGQGGSFWPVTNPWNPCRQRPALSKCAHREECCNLGPAVPHMHPTMVAGL